MEQSTNKWVARFYDAYENKSIIPNGILPSNITEHTAYDIQEGVLQRKEETEIHKGYKISLTSQETRDIFSSSTPLYGAMGETTVLNNRIYLNDFNEPLAELELVFIVQEELAETDSLDDIMRKCLIAPGVEVPDSRFSNWFPNLNVTEIIADSAVSGGVVYGEPKSFTYDDIDNIKGTLYQDDQEIATGYSTEVEGHPAKAVKWLISEIKEYNRALTPGMFISSGTFILPKPLTKGSFRAEYDNVGTVEFTVE
ncbi:2-keto-4-pentenoate hydratase [Mammaliicoccus stepanovicii]|uniref:2-oxo-hepta-3-ene-1,7-dioate hydratase n=1 Tax=Mammaliicoccus stepanovicii TaxID=643214 RepID=A0A240A7G8_9STAP|nr:hydratase [Mammaliicoccus stepanovicii]PNZ77173.1 hydratase [Mammaliicoccus stepanovicii]GGI39655.1 2-keto-4-pentenoate hydratase [Mammaliicoccus stepanovicii]SNV79287.1 2-oxo-hepta-3-ene-1,7-dioate hydratase [Mammaliicoccus stepanovicii]